MIMPSKKGLLCLSKPALHFFHHPFRVVVTVVGGRLPTCSQLMSLSQLALVKLQSLHKCVGVSGSLLHSLHSVSCGQPLFAKLSAVKIFFWSRSQAKKTAFGFGFGLPNWVEQWRSGAANELNTICTFCCVFSIRCPSPSNLIICIGVSCLQLNHLPQLCIFSDFHSRRQWAD